MVNVYNETKTVAEGINPETIKDLIGRAQRDIHDLQEFCALGYQRLAQLNVMQYEDEVLLYRTNNVRVEYRIEVIRFEAGKPAVRFWPTPQAYGIESESFSLTKCYGHKDRKAALEYAATLARQIGCPVVLKGFELHKNESDLFEGVDMVLPQKEGGAA